MSKTDKPHYIVRGEEVPAEEITFVDEDGYKWPEGAKPPTHILHKERNYFVIYGLSPFCKEFQLFLPLYTKKNLQNAE